MRIERTGAPNSYASKLATPETMSEQSSQSMTDDSNDTECPTCDRVFDTEAGVKQHHYMAHDASIAGVEITCEWCGGTKTKRPSQAKEGRNFCGMDCRDKWMSQHQENKTEVDCHYCGDTFKIHPFRLEQAERHFCPGASCYGDWQSEHRVGKDSPNWDGGTVGVDCEHCGAVFEVEPHREESAKYCSRECSDEAKTIERSPVECVVCGDEFRPRPGEDDRKYCSNDCQGKEFRGENNPRYNRTIVECTNCGRELERIESRVVSVQHHFCNQKCQGEWLSEKPSGEDHPQYNRVERECAGCGESLKVIPARAEYENVYCNKDCVRDKGAVTCEYCGNEFEVRSGRLESVRFCKRECKHNWQKEAYSGDGNPSWAGGYEPYYGPNWEEQRRKAITRDQCRCQWCGDTPLDLGKEPSVHHIKRLGWFQENYDEPEWYEQGNDLDNLITLCPEHHQKVEGWSLRPDTR